MRALDTPNAHTAGSITEPNLAVKRPEQLMVALFHKCAGMAARSIAIGCAALVLISQLVGVAHFHEGSISNGVAQISTDAGLCPVCQLAMHSPGSVAAAPTVARGPLLAEPVFSAATIRFESPVLSDVRVRAPPIAL